MAASHGIFRRFFGALWHTLDFLRRLVVNLVFLALLLVVLGAWLFSGRVEPLEEKTALVVDLRGALVEQYTNGPAEALLANMLEDARPETRLRDVLAAIDTAATDDQIARAVLVLDDLTAAGMPSLRDIAEALARFKAEGKQVVAWSSNYSQAQYFLAAHADEVYLHPFGEIELRGMGGTGLYFRDALDKIGVTVHGFQAGKYKSFLEPFTRNAPSAEALEADAFWLNDAWATWTGAVEQARKLPAGAIARLIDQMPERLAATRGDMAQLALQEKLVDGLKTRDELRALMIERGAATQGGKGTFRQIAILDYLARQTDTASGDAIAVVVAEGEIVDDDAPAGVVSGRATAELLREAREDDQVKAVVLRVNSPGGSAFGSELIRREVELLHAAGKPVVASMGDVAASGGYWISMSADEIVADEATITGSIGVGGLVPTFEKTLEKVGVGTGGASTTWLAQASSPLQPLDPRLAAMLDQRIGHVYRRFIDSVAAGRKRSFEQIDAVAQGRVWTGRQAAERGLVDTLGGLNDALDSAATRAKLGDDYRITYIEPEARGWDRWLKLFSARVSAFAREQFGLTLPGLAAPAREVARASGLLARAGQQPLAVYTHCFCRAP